MKYFSQSLPPNYSILPGTDADAKGEKNLSIGQEGNKESDKKANQNSTLTVGSSTAN